MSQKNVSIIHTEVANTASVIASFERLGAQVSLSQDKSELEDADYLVLPGVGSFSAAIGKLNSLDLASVLKKRIEDLRPTLCVCLGLQLLASSSEESEGEQGLSVFSQSVGRFSSDVRIPQIGWNKVQPLADCKLLTAGYAYFANSYCLKESPPGWASAYATHGEPFIAALEKGPVLACQFHPELSSDWGKNLLARWLNSSCGGIENAEP